jgi:EAL domain-containing protein (putative c-di-GMP-specific phosphodiesterase class I)
MKVVAEGVEDAEQLDFLASKKCDIVQGYFFSKPLPLPKLQEWLEVHEAHL